MKKSKRVVIAKDTLSIFKKGYYTNSEKKQVHVSKKQKFSERNTRLFLEEELNELVKKELEATEGIETEIIVNDKTTLDSVRDEVKNNSSIIYLNFASARNPGGGFLKGSQAQEESIARATGLYPCLLRAEKYYLINRGLETCLYSHNMIYSPEVAIIKDELGELLEEPVYADVLTSPAVNAGVVERNEPDNIDKIIPTMRERIERVLTICKEYNKEVLVLGAWGCGVFRNDPEKIAKLFSDALQGKFKNQFRKVVFSVYAKEDVYIKPFQEYFLGKEVDSL